MLKKIMSKTKSDLIVEKLVFLNKILLFFFYIHLKHKKINLKQCQII